MSDSITSVTDLGHLVRAERKRQGLRQEDLALAAGTGRRFIVDLERGKPTARLAEVLRVLRGLGLDVHVSTGRHTTPQS